MVDMSFPKCLLIGQQDESTKRKLENRSAEAHFRNVVKPLTVCGQSQSCRVVYCVVHVLKNWFCNNDF